MTTENQNIYQFKITLEDTKPIIWRRVQVPGDYTFSDLHLVIQEAMGWENFHMYQFKMSHPLFGMNMDNGPTIQDEQKKFISSYFSSTNKTAIYEYDFGDSWIHTIYLEKILKPQEGKRYPLCLDGKRACPPEDCGGPWGYQDLLTAIKKPSRKGHREYEEVIDKDFDPSLFHPKSVKFSHLKKKR